MDVVRLVLAFGAAVKLHCRFREAVSSGGGVMGPESMAYNLFDYLRLRGAGSRPAGSRRPRCSTAASTVLPGTLTDAYSVPRLGSQ